MNAGRRLLLRCLAPDDADALYGDLLEERDRLVHAGVPRWRASASLTGHLLLACAHGLIARIRAVRPGRVVAPRLWIEAGRSVLRRPGGSLVIIATLALGLGANTAALTVLNATLWRPLPFPHADELMLVREYRPQQTDSAGASYLNFLDWRAANQTFSSMALVTSGTGALGVGTTVVRTDGAFVSPGFFHTLGLSAALGRTFDDARDEGWTSEGLPALMLSDAGWHRHFHADPAIVGQPVTLNGRLWHIVGVTPAGILPLAVEPIDFWASTAAFGLASDADSANGSRNFRQYFGVLARLRPGISRETALADLTAINVRLATSYPRVMANRAVSVEPIRAVFLGDAPRFLWILFGLAGAVLAIACVNVANLSLAHASTRRREVAVRRALGARRIDVVMQFAAESLLVSTAGGLCGGAVAMWLVPTLSAMLPPAVPRLAGLAPDWRVFLGALAATVVTALVSGVWPALTATAGRASASPLSQDRDPSSGPVPRRLRNTLVTAGVAVSFAVLAAAGVMTNSLVRLGRVAPGFETNAILTSRLSIDGARYESGSDHPVHVNQLLDDLDRRLRAMPGVSDVAFAQSVPFTGVDNNTRLTLAWGNRTDRTTESVRLRFVSPTYFRTVGIPLTEGRPFMPADTDDAPRVAIVNAAFVRAFAADGLVVGRVLSVGWGGNAPKTIVGVIGDVRHHDPGDLPRPEVYVPQAQFGNTDITVLVRNTSGAEALAPAIASAIRAADPLLAFDGVKALDRYRTETLAAPRFGTWLLSGFGAIALTLAIVGLYGVTSYATAQRTQEIGVRLALGAQTTDVLRLLMGQALTPVGVGLVLGLGAALLTTRVLRGWLYDVSPSDPLTLALVASVLAVTAGLACYVPARRGGSADPLQVLRRD